MRWLAVNKFVKKQKIGQVVVATDMASHSTIKFYLKTLRIIIIVFHYKIMKNAKNQIYLKYIFKLFKLNFKRHIFQAFTDPLLKKSKLSTHNQTQFLKIKKITYSIPLYSSSCSEYFKQKVKNFISMRFSTTVTFFVLKTSAREQGT